MTPNDLAPIINQDVLYVAYGTPGGEFQPGAQRAAKITEVCDRVDGVWHASIFVMNPTGLFFNQNLPHDPSGTKPGTWHFMWEGEGGVW